MSSSIPTPTVALSASAFDQSIGVNIHLWETGSAYTNLALVESDLAYLGVDNVRDQLVNWSQTQPEYTALMSLGYKFDFIEEPVLQNTSSFLSAINAFETAYPGSIKAVEGPNEVDLANTFTTSSQAANLAGAHTFEEQFFAAVQADATLNGVPVYDLTLGSISTANYAALGNLSAYANFANDHLYSPDSDTPEAGLSLLLPYAQLDAPGLPTVITETGYDTNPADTYSGVDQTVQAKLTLDTLMDAFKAGVSQTYLYELFDDASGNWGLFNADGTPKLAATAIHNLTTLLADPGSTASFTPGSLSYSVPNLPSNANQLLVEKSTGTFDLVLWAEAQIWNPTTGTEVTAPTETTTVDFGQTQSVVEVFDPLDGTTPIATYTNVNSIQVALTDHPLIIEIPDATTTTTASGSTTSSTGSTTSSTGSTTSSTGSTTSSTGSTTSSTGSTTSSTGSTTSSTGSTSGSTDPSGSTSGSTDPSGSDSVHHHHLAHIWG
jgi:hypothetical protein